MLERPNLNFEERLHQLPAQEQANVDYVMNLAGPRLESFYFITSPEAIEEVFKLVQDHVDIRESARARSLSSEDTTKMKVILERIIEILGEQIKISKEAQS